ncbi:MAG: flagellin lysine-N-methylase [Anaerobacillus sp.]|uniref:flagellin lysine-N-methylase n=1 Tax=Anaerobacillus sp. TaxID=1872506 RepID=UPI00391C2354
MEQKKVLTPTYMRDFSCIGADCEDTCCSGWQITIDEKSYNRLLDEDDNENNLSLSQHVKLLKSSNSNSENYAEIVLNSQSFCPLLSENRLCTLHKEKGEEFLPNICAAFPRISNIVNGNYEKSLTLSCPEAARKVLLNEEGIRFDEMFEEIGGKQLLNGKINTVKLQGVKRERNYFLELREISINILQNRDLSLSSRLIKLGEFLKEVHKSLVNSIDGNIQYQIEMFKHITVCYKGREGGNASSFSTEAQVTLIRGLIDKSIFTGIKEKRYLNCLLEALEGLKYTGSNLNQESVDIFNYHSSKLTDKYEHILENYLVNYCFKNLFPVTKGLLEDYMILIVHYALIKFHLIGLMNRYEDQFNTQHIITLVQSFSRNIEHSYNESSKFIDFLKENEITSFESVSVLI